MRWALRGTVWAHWSQRLLQACLLGAFALSTAGCGSTACSLMGCEDRVTFVLASPLAASSDYLVRVEMDSTEVECTFVPDGSGCLELHPDTQLDGIRAVILVGHTPSRAVLTIHRDGVLIVDETVSGISYQHDYPNGKRCDDGCRQATVVLD